MRNVLLAASVVILLTGAPGCSSKPGGFRGGPLSVLSGARSVDLKRCPTAKCLTVYVAPWCGYCRASSEFITALREHLQSRRVSTRIVVGLDRIQAVREYASTFGPDTLLDPQGELGISGVPHFIVSDSSGKFLKSVAGTPGVLSPPWNEDAMSRLAALYGLP